MVSFCTRHRDLRGDAPSLPRSWCLLTESKVGCCCCLYTRSKSPKFTPLCTRALEESLAYGVGPPSEPDPWCTSSLYLVKSVSLGSSSKMLPVLTLRNADLCCSKVLSKT